MKNLVLIFGLFLMVGNSAFAETCRGRGIRFAVDNSVFSEPGDSKFVGFDIHFPDSADLPFTCNLSIFAENSVYECHSSSDNVGMDATFRTSKGHLIGVSMEISSCGQACSSSHYTLTCK